MGKDSKHQRTKGGVQPSSSSRTAELLEKSGAGAGALSFLAAAAEAHKEFGVGGAGGAGGGGGTATPTATALTNLLVEDDLPPEVRLTFRKLQKKDGVTKIKALTELAVILGVPEKPRLEDFGGGSPALSRDSSVERSRRSPEELEELSKLLLPHWAKAFQKLVTDDSRKVRETVYLAHTQLCRNVGRNLAPYLKQLMPSWYLAQCDLYSPVASAARRSFNAVFPAEGKQVEVVKFCKSEILKIICEHLQGPFRGAVVGEGGGGPGKKEKKKQQAKKKGGQDEQGDVSVEAAVVLEGSSVSSSGEASAGASAGASGGHDGESISMRVSFASVQALNCLIERGLVEDDVLEEVFGEMGLFWAGAEYSNDISIRRSCFNLLTSLTRFLFPVSGESVSNFRIPPKKCIKFINAALSANQKETLPSLWNTFLLLTIRGVLSDVQLARKQLLLACKNGFYGNASQIGPSVLPLLARIWAGIGAEDDLSSREEFAHDIIKATIQGYGVEKSQIEKAAIARSLVETFGFLCKHIMSRLDLTQIYSFILSNISELNSDVSKLMGTLIKDESVFEGLSRFAIENGQLNSKHLGTFFIGVCCAQTKNLADSTATTSSPGGTRKIKKSVKFAEPEEDSSSNTDTERTVYFETLTEQKQHFIQGLLKLCVENQAYQPIAVLSRTFRSELLWKDVNPVDIEISVEEDKVTRLQLTLELVHAFPENPAILAKFSDSFEFFQKESSDFKTFLNELNGYIQLQPIKRWIRMNVFTAVVERFVTTGDLTEQELQAILRFVLRDSIFSPEYTSHIVGIIKERLEVDPKFFDIMSHILSSSTFKTDLSIIYEHFWDLYFLRSVSLVDSDLELIETVCFRNQGKFSIARVSEILEKYLDSCERPQQVDVLIEVAKRLGFSSDMVGPLPKLNIKSEVLSFISESSSEILHESLEPVPKFSKVHRSAISKAIFKGKLMYQDFSEDSEELDLINPLLNVIYAQAVARIWSEIEKSGYFDSLNQELSNELDVVSSRLTEKIHESKSAWKRLWEELNMLSSSSNSTNEPSSSSASSPSKSSLDPIWQSKLLLRIVIDYCCKAEIKDRMVEVKYIHSVEHDFKQQVDIVLDNISRNSFQVKDVIHWITEKRAKLPSEFEFEILFRQARNKILLHKLLVITVKLLENLDRDGVEDDETAEEFLGLAACWIAAWLKQTKTLLMSPVSKLQLSWISNLAKGVKIIGDKARNHSAQYPKFTQEYVEFHSAQLYPVIYSLFLNLNQDFPSHTFWTVQTLFYLSSAITTIPSNTLAFIEPDSVKLCETFGTILGSGVSLACKVAAYRVLKKVRYDRTGEGDLPIIPPVMDNVIKTLHRKKRERETGEFVGPDEDALIPYLLMWDALLKIQQGSNEFATYVRDQDHLLTPFLNTVFFSERISLDDAKPKSFDTDVDLTPGRPINLLHLGCSVVLRTLRNLPYTVRWWWNNQISTQGDRQFVEKFIVKHLSSKLASEELGGVKLREGVDNNVTVQCHKGCNELVAHYKIEETNVTLTVSLPLNHPLGPVTVKISDKKLHGKISHLLNTRSHSLSAGLKLWKENLDGLYKDVDECAICFFILHNVTKQIPKLACKTCKKKFHAACLYKWFSTSNKSECPLCRNLF